MWAGRIDGPECLLARGSEIYASQRGQVVKINGEHITHVARFGQACGQLLLQETIMPSEKYFILKICCFFSCRITQ